MKTIDPTLLTQVTGGARMRGGAKFAHQPIGKTNAHLAHLAALDSKLRP